MHSQDVINPEPPCTYGTALTKIFGADSNSISESEPLRVPFHFKWPVGEKNHAFAFQRFPHTSFHPAAVSHIAPYKRFLILDSSLHNGRGMNTNLMRMMVLSLSKRMKNS